MGTTNVTDAVTNETIYEGSKVIAFLLSAAQPTALGHFSTSQYKISSFPMVGTWDGNYVVPDDEMSFSSNFNQILVQSGEGNHKSIPDTFVDVQKKIARTPEINGNCYTLMIIKEDTLELLRSMSGMDFKMNYATVESDIKNFDALSQEYLRVADLHENGDNSEGIRRHIVRLQNALEFKSYDDTLNSISVPMVGGALIRDSACPFSERLVEMVEDLHHPYSIGGYLREYRELPNEYNEVATQLHHGLFIAKALDIMGRQVAPSMTTIARQDDSYTLELASKVIKQEFSSKLAFAQDHGSTSFLKEIDQDIEQLKQMLSEVIQQRKVVGKQIQRDIGPTGELGSQTP